MAAIGPAVSSPSPSPSWRFTALLAVPGRRRAGPAVLTGAVIGATARWGVGEWLAESGGWPWGTFVTNVLGSVLLGVLVGRWGAPLVAPLHVGWSVGVCGGLTTFSTFAVDVVELARSDRLVLASGYLVASVVAGVAGFVAGGRVGSRVA